MILFHIEIFLFTIFIWSIFGIILNEETERSKTYEHIFEFTFGISFIGLIVNSICMILNIIYNWIFN